jgi:tRNA pseudouridine13 synthase
MTLPHLQNLPHAWGNPVGSAELRVTAEDFQVEEIPVTEPDGAGEHVWVQIRKRETNTDWLAQALAKFCGVRGSAISYAGLKDRHALTTQWFSVHLINKPEPDWQAFNCAEYTVLQHVRHSRKLRRGALRGNRFILTLRNVQGDKNALAERLQLIQTRGVPNYFGAQRFGHDEHNLLQAEALFRGELQVKNNTKRGLFISAARSFVFNHIVAHRVSDNSWHTAQVGDVAQLHGSHSVFCIAQVDEAIAARLVSHDIHLTGAMWGTGNYLPQGDIAALEHRVANTYPIFRDALAALDLKQERRPLCLLAEDLRWQWQDDSTLQLSFALPAGAYATTVLRELVRI